MSEKICKLHPQYKGLRKPTTTKDCGCHTYWKKKQNRLGLTSFIKDAKRIDELYEKALMDEHAIDMLDHVHIATTKELGVSFERELNEVKMKYNKLVEAIGNIWDVFDALPVDIDEMLNEEDLQVIDNAELYDIDETLITTGSGK